MAQNAPAQSSKSSGTVAGFKVFIGLVCIVWFAYTIVMDVQTSEAFIQGGKAINTFVPNWNIVQQPYDLVTVGMAPGLAMAVYYAWGVEIVFLICMVGWETSHAGVRHANKHLGGWFKTGCWVLVGLNTLANFLYGNVAGTSLGAHIGFALVTAFSVMFAGLTGLHMIEDGMGQMSH